MRFDRDDFGSNVEDRGRGGGFGFGGGGMGGGLGGMILPLILSRFGIGGVIILVVIMLFSGGLGGLLGGGGQQAVAPTQTSSKGGGSVEQVCRSSDIRRFTCNVYGSTEQVWTQIFAESGQRYRAPRLNFFQGGVSTGCGGAESAMGPFYCPADQGVYLDTTFFDELGRRFGAPGDFAAAYVVAHEVGHHIQTLTGTSNAIRQAQQGGSEAEGNALQVRMELQADCLAGVWASQVSRSGDRLDAGDLQEGLRAAEAIGDDTLQRSAGRRPVPESFTHGTSAQRQQALQRGFQGGTYESCASYTQGL